MDLSFFKSRLCLGVAFCASLFVKSACADDGSFSWNKNDESIALYDGDKPVFTYWYAFVDHAPLVPDNEPRRFAGSYIYPLYGLDGENLTDNAPKDHYHHHGVFWTWPGVYVHESDGATRKYDLWTSNTDIRQRFLKIVETSADAEKATLVVENGWFVGRSATTPDAKFEPQRKGEDIAENASQYGEKIMDERVTLVVSRVKNVEGTDSRAIDFELVLTPSNKPVSLEGAEKKSYGGLTIRFRPSGKNGVDRFITTDEGVAPDDMPEKRLRWADYTSRFTADGSPADSNVPLSGAAIFLAPSFPDYPPTWLTRYYGPLCLGYPGVDAQRFEPGKPVVMKARIWVHRGLVAPDALKKVYESYAEENR